MVQSESPVTTMDKRTKKKTKWGLKYRIEKENKNKIRKKNKTKIELFLARAF